MNRCLTNKKRDKKIPHGRYQNWKTQWQSSIGRPGQFQAPFCTTSLNPGPPPQHWHRHDSNQVDAAVNSCSASLGRSSGKFSYCVYCGANEIGLSQKNPNEPRGIRFVPFSCRLFRRGWMSPWWAPEGISVLPKLATTSWYREEIKGRSLLSDDDPT